MRKDLFASVSLTQACHNTVEPLLCIPLLSEHLHCPDSPNQYVACSLLPVMKFWLDKSSRREPTECCLLAGWIIYITTNSYHWLLGDKTFLQPRGGMLCSDFLSCPVQGFAKFLQFKFLRMRTNYSVKWRLYSLYVM